MTSADLLLHPIRLRIVQAFLGEQELTTSELKSRLPDVPVATLYRQVSALLHGGVLDVVAERRIRGAVERSLSLRLERASIRSQDAAVMSVDDHRAAFTTFIAGLLADFDRYLDRGDINFAHDLVGYRQAGFYATDDELEQVLSVIREAVGQLQAAEPTPDRRRRLLTTVLMPAQDS